MQQTYPLAQSRSLVVFLVAFVLGAGGATASYAVADGASLDLTSGDATTARVAGGEHTGPPPHAGTGGVPVSVPSPSRDHIGGGPPAEAGP